MVIDFIIQKDIQLTSFSFSVVTKNIVTETDARELFKMLVILFILLFLSPDSRQTAFLTDALPFCEFEFQPMNIHIQEIPKTCLRCQLGYI